MLDWRSFFPLTRPRPEQESALDRLCADVVSGKRLLVAELGTGVGKSAVAVTLARWLDAYEKTPDGFARGAVVLTSQKLLQDQYVKDFPTARDLRSAMNFQCNGPLGGTCAETSRVRKAVGRELARALSCPECPYRACKDAYAAAELGVTNYSYFLSETVYAQELPPRHMLILDEAHNVEDEVRRWASVEVSEKEASQLGLDLPDASSPQAAIEWLDVEMKGKIETRLGKLGSRLRKLVCAGNLSDALLPKLAMENEILDKRKCQINRLVGKGGKILVSSHSGKSGSTMRFQPLDVSLLSRELLYSRASACLLMSATLLDMGVFSKAVGLDGASYVGIPTPFKPESFGVKFRPIGRMNRNEIERSILSLPRAIKKILSEHPDEKGIVHTVNYRIAQEVAKAGDPRLLVQKSAEDRDSMLRRHVGDPGPTVLVSPSMMEGLDLRDHLGRFQVVCKMPYPDMSDPVTKEKDWDWYTWRTVRSLTQAIGRCVRSEDDWTKTYILDHCFFDVVERSSMVPRHITSALDVEEPF